MRINITETSYPPSTKMLLRAPVICFYFAQLPRPFGSLCVGVSDLK